MTRGGRGLAVAATLLVAAALACSSTGSSGEDAAANGECPNSLPTPGGPCGDASMCVYGAPCSATQSVCTNGMWVNTPDVPTGTACPKSAPDNGSTCESCNMPTPCTFNSTCDPEGGPTVAATCIEVNDTLTWNVMPVTCGPRDGGQKDTGAPDMGVDAHDGGDGGDAGKKDGGRRKDATSGKD